MGVDFLRMAVLPARTLQPTPLTQTMLTVTSKFTAQQWFTDFYPMGKTSIDSKWNIPGTYTRRISQEHANIFQANGRG